MNLMQINGHTYDEKMISSGGWVLDIGCQDFIVTRHFLNLGLKVVALDPLKLEIPSDLLNNKNFTFLNKACVGLKKSNTITYYDYNASGANSIYNTPEMLNRKINGGHALNPLREKYEVDLVTIQEITHNFSIKQFDIIKCDAEGAEYDILENLPFCCARQISVEFHDFLCLTPSINNYDIYNTENRNYWMNPQVISYHENLLKKMKNYNLIYQTKERDDVLFTL